MSPQIVLEYYQRYGIEGLGDEENQIHIESIMKDTIVNRPACRNVMNMIV